MTIIPPTIDSLVEAIEYSSDKVTVSYKNGTQLVDLDPKTESGDFGSVDLYVPGGKSRPTAFVKPGRDFHTKASDYLAKHHIRAFPQVSPDKLDDVQGNFISSTSQAEVFLVEMRNALEPNKTFTIARDETGPTKILYGDNKSIDIKFKNGKVDSIVLWAEYPSRSGPQKLKIEVNDTDSEWIKVVQTAIDTAK